ncbi:hydroxymethylbilane synthase [Magnetococcales bacterium HHB-1]
MSALLRIGTRGSQLALWQANEVKRLLQKQHPQLQVELVIIKTQGDKILDVPLAKVGGKGLFVKELEEAMLDHRVDLAVHSMKDMPTELPSGLQLTAMLPREDPRDVLLSCRFNDLNALPQGAVVGSSSLRRKSQLLHIRPDLQLKDLRGNVNTRIDKMVKGEYDAIILAAAGVKRLQLTQHLKQKLDHQTMLPAVAQGAIGIESRQNDPETTALLTPLNDPETWITVTAERTLMATLEGSCQIPIAGHAKIIDDQIQMTGRITSLDGQQKIDHTQTAQQHEAKQLGQSMGQTLLAQGGAAILEEILKNA